MELRTAKAIMQEIVESYKSDTPKPINLEALQTLITTAQAMLSAEEELGEKKWSNNFHYDTLEGSEARGYDHMYTKAVVVVARKDEEIDELEKIIADLKYNELLASDKFLDFQSQLSQKDERIRELQLKINELAIRLLKYEGIDFDSVESED